eukprot:jgi/Tetstr1/457764/TSEL_044309.t1
MLRRMGCRRRWWMHAHRRAAKLTVEQELRRARQALDTADLGMVSDAAAALPALDALHPPPAATGLEYSTPPEEPPDLQRAPPSWGDNADEVRRRCHSRTVAFLASGTVFALHKDDPAAREERGRSGELLRVRPLGVSSVLVRLASAHALGQVGADAREVMGPTSFLSRMMPPSELGPFLEAVDAANISAAFSLLGLDACDQSTPRMEDGIVQMSLRGGHGTKRQACSVDRTRTPDAVARPSPDAGRPSPVRLAARPSTDAGPRVGGSADVGPYN